MCRLLDVSRSAYCDHVRRDDNRPSDSNYEEMLDATRDIAKSSNYVYGGRRMKKALNVLSYPVSRWKARRLMMEVGMQVKRRKKYKMTTDSNHKRPVFENKLNRQFGIAKKNQVYVYVGDITYLWTQKAGCILRLTWYIGPYMDAHGTPSFQSMTLRR